MYTAKLLFELPRSSFVVTIAVPPILTVRVPHHWSKIHVLLMMRFPCGFHQLLVCREGIFVVPLKVATFGGSL